MGAHKAKTIFIGVVFFSLCVSAILQAAQLQPYYATDPNNTYPPGIGKCPNTTNPYNVWTVPPSDANGPVIGPIKPGQVVWLACTNTPDATKKKFFKIELKRISGSLGMVSVSDATGFADANSNHPIGGASVGDSDYTPDKIKRQYRFKQQPKWERIKIVNNSKHDVKFNVKTWSICGGYTGNWNVLHIEEGSFGAEGAMISYEPVTEVQCFPEHLNLDMGIASNMVSYMPGSGPWIAQPVLVDPDGQPRPHGGVKFTTLGSGLVPGSPFDLSFGMAVPPDGEKDIRYSIYTLDATGTWDKYMLDFTEEFCDGEILAGDLNSDCRVDFKDFAIMATNWLRCNDPLDPACGF